MLGCQLIPQENVTNVSLLTRCAYYPLRDVKNLSLNEDAFRWEMLMMNDWSLSKAGDNVVESNVIPLPFKLCPKM